MPRQNPAIKEFIAGASKIRKRVSSSSSASSSLLQNNRFKRAIIIGKRGGSTTPAPNWRMNPKSPSASSKISDPSRQQGPVSARKLANALWELNMIPSPEFSENFSARRSKKVSKPRPHRLSDPLHSPDSERSGPLTIMPIVSQRIRSKERNDRALDLLSSSSLMEALDYFVGNSQI
ncbi:uncharacterized protein A4U43_C02F13740 [Asparagus officinalis]|uniref:Uncharacterized protein n=1 Tax=Asparagus officinalis TaxID=4686 RepID=A0A5P1FK07_ASPOF|nr:uncharacterized protein A4U43_C02F13740 [Asparagus officinalis]